MATQGSASSPEYGGKVFGQYIDAQLTEERSRKNSLEQRGIAIITSAGTLATLLFGIAAFSRSPTSSFQLTGPDETALIVALGLLLLSAILGLATNWILNYAEPDLKYLDELTHNDEDHWRFADVVEASRLIAEAEVGQLQEARKRNDFKAIALQVALWAEILAILALTVTVLLPIFHV